MPTCACGRWRSFRDETCVGCEIANRRAGLCGCGARLVPSLDACPRCYDRELAALFTTMSEPPALPLPSRAIRFGGP